MKCSIFTIFIALLPASRNLSFNKYVGIHTISIWKYFETSSPKLQFQRVKWVVGNSCEFFQCNEHFNQMNKLLCLWFENDNRIYNHWAYYRCIIVKSSVLHFLPIPHIIKFSLYRIKKLKMLMEYIGLYEMNNLYNCCVFKRTCTNLHTESFSWLNIYRNSINIFHQLFVSYCKQFIRFVEFSISWRNEKT